MTGMLSHIELMSMLNSLSSTLSAETVNSFFTWNGKKPQEDKLTFSKAIQCLETKVGWPNNKKKHINHDNSLLDLSNPSTPSMAHSLSSQASLQLGKLDFSGPPIHPHELEILPEEGRAQKVTLNPEFSQQTPSEAATGRQKIVPSSYPSDAIHWSSGTSSDTEDSSGSRSSSKETFKRVINIKNCPLCHCPPLNKKAEMDIITHITVCVSSNWAKINKIMVGNFVTTSQAQRKWYTKVISNVSSGSYRLGAVCFFVLSFIPLRPDLFGRIPCTSSSGIT
jgi:phosphatidylserine decarboxylase